ncbi:MAG: hypothetical protein AAFR42_07015 [Cyanobacteria bacterium J06628_6]
MPNLTLAKSASRSIQNLFLVRIAVSSFGKTLEKVFAMLMGINLIKASLLKTYAALFTSMSLLQGQTAQAYSSGGHLLVLCSVPSGSAGAFGGFACGP